MRQGGKSGSVLFVPPKHYHFADPELEIVMNESDGTAEVTAAAYAKGVEIYGSGGFVPEDNFFDMEPGTRKLKILCRNGAPDRSAGNEGQLRVRSVFDIH